MQQKHTDNGYLYNLVKFVAPSQAMQANQARNKPLHSKPVNISLEVEVINLILVLSVCFKSSVDSSHLKVHKQTGTFPLDLL